MPHTEYRIYDLEVTSLKDGDLLLTQSNGGEAASILVSPAMIYMLQEILGEHLEKVRKAD